MQSQDIVRVKKTQKRISQIFLFCVIFRISIRKSERAASPIPITSNIRICMYIYTCKNLVTSVIAFLKT